MRLRIVCLSLLLALVLPLALAGCSKETEPENNPAKIFTLYCITGETTKPEAITRWSWRRSWNSCSGNGNSSRNTCY